MRLTADHASPARRRRSTRLRGAALLAAGLTTLLAGCSAGQISQTALTEPSVPGVHADAGDISLRNVQIVYGGREHPNYEKGGDAPLDVRIFNTGAEPDVLTGVKSPAAERVTLVSGDQVAGDENEGSGVCPEPVVDAGPDQPASTFTIALKPGACALLAPGHQFHLQLGGLTEKLAPGDAVDVTFTFGQAGDVTLKVPFGMPTEGANHSPVNMHPEEPEVVGGHKGGEGEGGH